MIITFDIHGVLFTTDYKKIFQLIMRNLSALKLVIYCAYPRFIKDAFLLLKKGAVPEEYINTLTSSYKGLTPYKQLAIELANAQKPNLTLFSIVKELKSQGYTLHIFSNIGYSIFNHLAQQNPEIFNNFDAVFVPTSANNYLAKPNPQAFAQYLALHNPANKRIIFIDNRRTNISISKLHGMHGIRFRSANKLAEELAQLCKQYPANK